jgi:hypothetical protein
MHAALYDLYELLCAATQLADGPGAGERASERGLAELAALSKCLSLVDAVARGAELHVFLACALLERASALRGADSPQVGGAWRAWRRERLLCALPPPQMALISPAVSVSATFAMPREAAADHGRPAYWTDCAR